MDKEVATIETLGQKKEGVGNSDTLNIVANRNALMILCVSYIR